MEEISNFQKICRGISISQIDSLIRLALIFWEFFYTQVSGASFSGGWEAHDS
jgi:hypothetical protein